VLLAKVGLHVLAVLILAVASAALFASEAGWRIADWAWRQGTLVDAVLLEASVHVGLCGLVWAALVVCFGRLRTLIAMGKADEPATIKLASPKELVSRSGTVLTETIIVLPIALLLIFGIAQLALVNIASTLSDLAAIQAARTIWVWEPEAREGRFNVDRALVKEKARVQAAAIMAPTASSNFGTFNTSGQPGYDQTFRKAMGAMYGATVEHGGSDVGSYSSTQAEMELSAGYEANRKNLGFDLAFDSDDFRQRTARKFFNAWSQTEIEMTETREQIGVRLTYHHLCLMPVVASIFGDYAQINGNKGYYLTMERTYNLPRHEDVKPNKNLPLR
jgi:hypothetical protein